MDKVSAVAVEVAHYMAPVPFVFLVVLWLLGARPKFTYWLFALAAAASLIGEVGHLVSGGGWEWTPWWPILQFGLFAWAIASEHAAVVVVLAMAAIAVAASGSSVHVIATVSPRLMGAALVLLLLMLPAMLGRPQHELHHPVLIYCGLGTLLFAMSQLYVEPRNDLMYGIWWYPYQVTRLAAFGLFGRKAWKSVGEGVGAWTS